mgnify:CR=1 FL=1
MIDHWKNTSMDNISEVVNGVLEVEEWLPNKGQNGQNIKKLHDVT